jgi:hypothetical protein
MRHKTCSLGRLRGMLVLARSPEKITAAPGTSIVKTNVDVISRFANETGGMRLLGFALALRHSV